jgi:hypothetical protein
MSASVGRHLPSTGELGRTQGGQWPSQMSSSADFELQSASLIGPHVGLILALASSESDASA